jgi:tryptophanyl-tRNA synthetase
MLTPLGWLERVPTYKEQQENLTGKDLTTYGFLGYPLLQAADILLYQADFVPVGQDQVAHVELTREVARRFNSMYKSAILSEPEALLTPTPKLPGTDGRKMSKSYGNTIGLSEPPMLVATKVHRMSTNGQRLKPSDPGDPDLCPVGDLHKIFSSAELAAQTQEICRKATYPCEWCKLEAGESVVRITSPIHFNRQKLEARIDETWEMLLEQSKKAQAVAEETMHSVRAAMGVTHELGALRRYYGISSEEREKLYHLTDCDEWLNMATDQRNLFLRDYWVNNLVSRDARLTKEQNRVFASLERELEEPYLTSRKKRVLVTATVETAVEQPDGWHFQIPARSYEVWTLICWKRPEDDLYDFVLPQSIYAQHFAKARKLVGKNATIHLRVRRYGEKWQLQFVDLNRTEQINGANVIPEIEFIDITQYLRNYQPLL